jgi:hypothetical protein
MRGLSPVVIATLLPTCCVATSHLLCMMEALLAHRSLVLLAAGALRYFVPCHYPTDMAR